MLLFARTAILQGSPDKSLAWAGEMTAQVNTLVEPEVTLWISNFGRPLGTVAWSAMIESRAQLAAANDALMADKKYLDLSAKGQEFITQPGEDLLRELVHGDPPESSPQVGAVATITTAIAALGKVVQATEWGIDTADYVSGVIGSPVGYFHDQYAAFGQMSWIGLQDDVAAADTAAAKLASDPGYLERISAIGDLFVPGSGHQQMSTRIA